jgi:hypothetical protein
VLDATLGTGTSLSAETMAALADVLTPRFSVTPALSANVAHGEASLIRLSPPETPSDGKGLPTASIAGANTRNRHLERAVFATFRTIAVPSGNTTGSDAEWQSAVGGAERDGQAARRS